MLGAGRSKLYGLVATGVVPSIRVGHTVRVPMDLLREWIRQQAMEGVTKAK